MHVSGLGPMLLGMVVGWLLYYFIRQYRVFSPQTLSTTIAAFLGGIIVRYFSQSPEGAILAFYSLGVGIGFFLYAAYLGFLLNLLYDEKIDWEMYNFAAGSGGVGESDSRRAAIIIKAVDAYKEGKMTKREVEKIIRRTQLSGRRLARMLSWAPAIPKRKKILRQRKSCTNSRI
jgi:hypothetical protein